MPTTYNGIGTHYYGKKNRHTRQAVCQQCGRSVTLTSYETRLWFVVVFIPVIPLGRKHIKDECSACSRHYAISAKEWQIARQTQTAAAMDQFRQSPSEDSALAVHGTLIAFQQHEEATEFRQTMQERFPRKAFIRAGLASQLENEGLYEEALPLWTEAYKLDPDLPEAKIGLAQRKMRQGDLDEARKMLSFLEESGAEKQFSLQPLSELASRFQTGKRHEDALEIMNVLLLAFPNLATDHQFRGSVRTSEKAIRKEDSILPDLKHSVGKLFTRQYTSGHRWVVGLTVAAALAVIGLGFNNEYVRRHQPLTVVNGTGATVQIQIDGQPSVSVVGKQIIPVMEGSHVVTVSGAVEEQHTLNVTSEYWARWTSNPVWIINVGGEGLIVDMAVYYSEHPRQPDVRIVADPVFIRHHVDYAFEEPPTSMSLDKRGSTVTKSVLSWFDPEAQPGGSVSGYLTLQKYSTQQAWEFALRKLRRHPDDENLVRYVGSDVQPAQRVEFQHLLEEKLDHRPVSIYWHRIYQDLPNVSADYDETVARYDAMLATEPKNGALLYLRGRIDRSDEQQRRFNQQAMEADPNLAWPEHAAGFDAMSLGHWEAALQHFDVAIQKGFPADEIAGIKQATLLALNRDEEAEALNRATLKESPADLRAAIRLAEILIRNNHRDEADQVMNQAINSFTAQTNGEFMNQVHATSAVWHYYQHEVASAIQEAAKTSDMDVLRLMMLIEQGDFTEAVEHMPTAGDIENQWIPLLCSLGFFAEADSDNADLWFHKTVAHFESLGPRSEAVTQILKSEVSLEIATRVQVLTRDSTEKAMLLTIMGTRAASADIRRDLYAAAQKWMIRPGPPRGLLEKIHAMETFPP